LAKASSLSKTAYERYRAEVHNTRPGQLAGLISQAEFLKTGGRVAADPTAGLRLASAPAFGSSNTRIELAAQPAPSFAKRKPKR